MNTKRTCLVLCITFFVMWFFYSCEKQTDKVNVTYRVIDFQDGAEIFFRVKSDTLTKSIVLGKYTLATPWKYSFIAEQGDIVYISLKDTVENSFSRAQILINGKIFKEKSRNDDRFMPVVVSGIIPVD